LKTIAICLFVKLAPGMACFLVGERLINAVFFEIQAMIGFLCRQGGVFLKEIQCFP
jgi:hypothetical protein